jgi:hypothetical protein
LGIVLSLQPRAGQKPVDGEAWLEVDDIEVIFTGRTINENVTV